MVKQFRFPPASKESRRKIRKFARPDYLPEFKETVVTLAVGLDAFGVLVTIATLHLFAIQTRQWQVTPPMSTHMSVCVRSLHAILKAKLPVS